MTNVNGGGGGRKVNAELKTDKSLRPLEPLKTRRLGHLSGNTTTRTIGKQANN
jgi:hypothetical protein